MGFSVNTNAGALIALQNLNATTKQLNVTQNRINTGLKVAGPKDNAAIYAIAQKLRADLGGLNAVKQSLDRASSVLDVALAAGEAVSDLLIQMKEKAVAAADAGIDADSRTALNDEFVQLRDQITTIVENAEFNGINAVQADDVVAIVDKDAANIITITAQGLSLGGTVVTVTAGAAISGATAGFASDTLAQVNASIDLINTALSKLGAGAKRIELQRTFVDKLSDAIEIGIGNLVDADLAKESANLQSLQVKQQLGLQALSIANQAPGSVLSLFR